jgi:acetyl-CoA C-acetyltransferase
MNEAWIIDACRTPRGIGKQGKGALADMHPQHLGATVLKALAERTGINTAEVDDIIWGTSTQKGTQGADLGRMAALDAGYDVAAAASRWTASAGRASPPSTSPRPASCRAWKTWSSPAAPR